MYQDAATMFDRERIRAKAHLARAAVGSRQDISQLALGRLQQEQREQYLANVQTKLRATAVVEQKYAADTTALAYKYKKETAEWEDARFALYEKFDEKRDAWAAAVKKLLREESAKHARVVESWVAYKQEQDRAAMWPDHKMRDCAHVERLAGLEVEWKLRQAGLKKQQRPARVKIEVEYSARLDELLKEEKDIEQRQTDRLEILANERKVALATVLLAFKAKETELQTERRRVDEWWDHLEKEGAACLREIYEDEQRALQEVDLMEAAKAEKVAAELEVQGVAPAAEAAISAANVGTTVSASPEITNNNDAAAADVLQTGVIVEQPQVANPTTSPMTVEEGEHSSALAAVPDMDAIIEPPAQVANTVASLTTAGDHNSALDTANDAYGPLVELPASTINEPSSSLFTNGRTTLPSLVPTNIEAFPTSEHQPSINSITHFVHAGVHPICVGRKRANAVSGRASHNVFRDMGKFEPREHEH